MSQEADAPGRRASEPPADAAILDQAARWLARIWSEDASDADRSACERWRAQDPEHERVFSRLLAFDGSLRGLPQDAAQRALHRPRPPSPRRRRALRLTGLGVVTCGAAMLGLGQSRLGALIVADHRTGVGEVRRVVLADGTVVTLAPSSAVDIRLDAVERRITLHRGEVLVQSAPDPVSPGRPLRVHNRDGQVEAIGTLFRVRQYGEETGVSVFEGLVEVSSRDQSGRKVRVPAGQSTAFDVRGVGPVASGGEGASAWARGLLIARNMRVAEFVEELGRFRGGWLSCDPEVADLRVTGTFALQDTDRALRNLALVLPIETVYRTRYWVRVKARPPASQPQH